ncbi:MAG: DNA topoisomerase-1 [Kiritimatiellia bacterium]|jgi:DNA topoisomerase-1
MGKSLVIVESPAKAKTINKYLGKDFVVKSSVGHIRDLPTGKSGLSTTTPAERAKMAAASKKLSKEDREKQKKKKAITDLVRKMGVDPHNGWKAQYEILPGKEKVVRDLREAAKNADAIYLATDLDREGEAIAWHLKTAIGGDESRYKRVVFNEITKTAIQEAFSKPGELDINHVNAQQARRFLDRVVGFSLSPLLWSKVARNLSAGRVQSVAVKLVVEREQEIRAFIAEEFWRIHADLTTPGQETFATEVKRGNGKAFRPTNKAEADEALAKLKAAEYRLAKREDKPTQTKPSAPLITSTLQQAASTRLGFGVKKTMVLAQRLYEAGHITYMRTDSTNLSKEAVTACRDLIKSLYGEQYVPEEPRLYGSKSSAQEAHEAIRPSDATVRAASLEGVERDMVRLYELIWNQFVACQMPNAQFDSTSLVISASDYELRASGRVMRFDGFTRVLPPLGKNEKDQSLPDIKEGDILGLVELLPQQHFTKPPGRYSEASLVKELESRGIGRPSTYASIISTIQDRGYVTVENRRFYAEKIGEIVTERLDESFPKLMSYEFTSWLESELDGVATKGKDWKQLLDEYYADFKMKLDRASNPDGGMRKNDPVATDIECKVCARHMMIRTASTGVFLSCSGYALPPKERCKETMPLTPGDEAKHAETEEEEFRMIRELWRCPKCNTAMDEYLVDKTRKLHICGNNPDCDGFAVETGTFVIKGYEGPVLDCDKCASEMQLKSGRFGKYFGCTNAECKNTRKLLRSGEPAPPKADPIPMPELACDKVEDTYVLRDGASGLFLAASKFPKHRETRPPKVAEILPHKGELDPKFLYITEAPVADPEGNPTTLRYSRKTKEQYLATEKDGKATGWVAKFRNGLWIGEYTKGPKKKAAPKEAEEPS